MAIISTNGDEELRTSMQKYLSRSWAIVCSKVKIITSNDIAPLTESQCRVVLLQDDFLKVPNWINGRRLRIDVVVWKGG